jgi:hypothetical protein
VRRSAPAPLATDPRSRWGRRLTRSGRGSLTAEHPGTLSRGASLPRTVHDEAGFGRGHARRPRPRPHPDQDPALRLDALEAAGCGRVHAEEACGAQRDRPELAAAPALAREGDTPVVRRPVETVEASERRRTGPRSPTEAAGTTTTPGGRPGPTSSRRSPGSSARSSASARGRAGEVEGGRARRGRATRRPATPYRHLSGRGVSPVRLGRAPGAGPVPVPPAGPGTDAVRVRVPSAAPARTATAAGAGPRHGPGCSTAARGRSSPRNARGVDEGRGRAALGECQGGSCGRASTDPARSGVPSVLPFVREQVDVQREM